MPLHYKDKPANIEIIPDYSKNHTEYIKNTIRGQHVEYYSMYSRY
jgi:hypothetical protein